MELDFMSNNITKTIMSSLENMPQGEVHTPVGGLSNIQWISRETAKSHLLQSQIKVIENFLKNCEEMCKSSSLGTPFCRNCKYAMVKSTGMGKIVFNWQCPNCGNYQEDLDDFSRGYNQALEDQISSLNETLEELRRSV